MTNATHCQHTNQTIHQRIFERFLKKSDLMLFCQMPCADAHYKKSCCGDTTDEEAGENKFSIKIPNMLSFMTYNSFSGEVKGIHDLQAEYTELYGEGNYVPQVTPLFWSFRVSP